MLNTPEWDMGPEDALQIDVVPHLPPSGGYENIITAMDVFSRYLFAYPVTNANALSVTKVIVDIMTRHAYLPTRIITDLGSVFVSQIVNEVASILNINLRHATVKHAQTIGILERTHASIKTSLKIATGHYRNQWHKYLPLAVLNYNTTFHTSLGCEPSRIFHGRIPYNVLDHKLGLNHNPKIPITTEYAEEILKRQEILLEKTKSNIMQAYLKYKAYYDKKAKASPLEVGDFCYILQPKADSQSQKIPFRDFQWEGPYVIAKVLENNNYIVRKVNTNKTHLLHRIRLKKFIPRHAITEHFTGDNFIQDTDIPINHDDLFAVTWETDFDDSIFPDVAPQENHYTDTQILPDYDNTQEPSLDNMPEDSNITGGEDTPASVPSEESAVGYNLRPSSHPFYSDKYRY